ncbi:phenylalanine--tRNA ligase beta subunit, cytoplasmic-like isoform X2 [Curcuma longa]|uniref:phenylalanine--tRNA ligase beta subunit, cytoplasmic-like isoform X2 n=1 Tax=Curcuma longa TaxID=136217 RepID=UPI003D9E01A7
MPTVSVGRDRLFAALGETYTQEEFEELCFKFGIELDDVTTEKAIIRKEKHLDEEGAEAGDEDEEVIYKIEVAANRYDLLCLEGIARALRIFIEKEANPLYTVSDVSSKSILKMHVKPEALPPQEINFVPLKQVKNFRADDLLEYYKSDMKLKKFLHIIEDSPVYPVIYDSNRTVLSLPPIINGAHSAINLRTRNVFIECTATDLTKAKIVLNTMVTMFSEYCEKKFEVEPVEVVYSDGKSMICPDLSVTRMEVPLSEIIDPIGISLDVSEVVALLNKMQLEAAHSSLATGDFNIVVSVPPTRSDILHARDVMEDVAIAYGYNNIPKSKPKCMTTGGRQPLNRFSDKVRAEVARAGYMEVLTWVLCSHEENFSMLRRKDDGDKAVIIANPRSADFEVVRTSLMSCLLKTLKHNIDHPRPIKIFEVGDVVVLDGDRDVGASNNRRLAALYCNVSSGFEEILGLVERIMKVVRAPHIKVPDNYLKPSDEPEYFPNRQCGIIFNGKQIGNFGIVHPEVLKKFGIPDPCSFMEIDIQSLL